VLLDLTWFLSFTSFVVASLLLSTIVVKRSIRVTICVVVASPTKYSRRIQSRDTPGLDPAHRCIVKHVQPSPPPRRALRLQLQLSELNPASSVTTASLAIDQPKWLLSRANPSVSLVYLVCRRSAVPRTGRMVRRVDRRRETVTERVVSLVAQYSQLRPPVEAERDIFNRQASTRA
jgi:hypothetical protein